MKISAEKSNEPSVFKPIKLELTVTIESPSEFSDIVSCYKNCDDLQDYDTLEDIPRDIINAMGEKLLS